MAASLAEFEGASGIEVKVIVAGSGEALRLLANGDVELAFVHHPDAEERFLRDHPQAERRPIMASRFVLVGPVADPCALQKVKTLQAAFTRLGEGCGKFISRGDKSGTHGREQRLWRQTPSGLPLNTKRGWYLSVGSGMGEALRIATQLNGYLLIDIATWLNLKKNSDLKVLFDRPNSPFTRNPYAIISMNTGMLGKKLIDWFSAEQTRKLISGFRLEGEPIFVPLSP